MERVKRDQTVLERVGDGAAAMPGNSTFSSSSASNPETGGPDGKPRVLIVGGGPSGVRFASQLAERGIDTLLFNAEGFEPYNRVKLTPLLAGDVQLGDIYLPIPSAGPGKIDCVSGLRIEKINRAEKTILSADGGVWPYDKLVLATGSSAFIPSIPGKDLPGVYSFRDADDVSALLARSFSARRAVVIGGGLLGLEAARGMRKLGCDVTIVEHESRLMPRQLDEGGGAMLANRIEALDVDVRIGQAVAEIGGRDRVEFIRLRNGEVLPCETVILCTGVRANVSLARQAELSVIRGVLVDDKMRSADPDIFAIGECAEHQGTVYGLVGPALEHADVAAAEIAGEHKRYAGTLAATKLKVIGADVFSIGPIEQLEQERNTSSHMWRDGGHYRRIFITRGRLSGAIGVGPWTEASALQQAVTTRAFAYPWMVHRFRKDGMLWREPAEEGSAIPPQSIVCNCTGVTCGRLQEAIKGGAGDLASLKQATGASTVCGTCQPLVEEILAAGAPPKPIRWFQGILALSGLAALAALITVLAPRIPLPDAFGPNLWETLWFDNITKQWTGYSLLGITAAALLIGLRKRIRWLRRLGSYEVWRVLHLVIGVAAIAGLFVHTGFRPGDNLNLALFLSFGATLVFGAVAGLATGGDHTLRAKGVGSAQTPPRTVPMWLHVLALWPLPVLLIVHVLAVYAY